MQDDCQYFCNDAVGAECTPISDMDGDHTDNAHHAGKATTEVHQELVPDSKSIPFILFTRKSR